jgi:hypothetical protein
MTPGEVPFDAPPAWLPGGRRGESARAWWRDLASNVDALRERYPRALADVPTACWREADVAEQLGAVCSWRRDLDSDGSADPRDELAFHEALERLQERLERLGRAELLQRASPTRAPVMASSVDFEVDLRLLRDEPGVSLERAFRSPHDGRPGSA